MKIGILTFWQTLDNYGQVLQSYALQQVLHQMGHTPFIVRYDLIEGARRHPVSLIRRIARVLLFPIYKHRRLKRDKSLTLIEKCNKPRQIEEFRQRHFAFSPLVYASKEELSANPPAADCYVAGSDQVWARDVLDPLQEPFYLSFAPSHARRIAYAASFGTYECPPAHESLLRELLSAFDSIGCRENYGVQLCKKLNLQASKVLDPTLIAPLDCYNRLIEDDGAESIPYAFIYSLNISSPDQIRWSELKECLKEKVDKVVVNVASGYIQGAEIYEDVEYSYSTIPQWLALIQKATAIITPSFHGTVFAILFHRPFISVPLQGDYSKSNDRLADLLGSLGLEDRILTPEKSYKTILNSPIDWAEVDKRLDQQREESLLFLRDSVA